MSDRSGVFDHQGDDCRPVNARTDSRRPRRVALAGSAALLLCLAASCSVDRDANEAHGRECRANEDPYEGFCIRAEDGGAVDTGVAGGGGDASADAGPGIAEGACDPGEAERPCFPSDVVGAGTGKCKLGTQLCSNGAWSRCLGFVAPQSELCNEEDDDCDGRSDEESTNATCMTGREGLCGRGEQVCAGGLVMCRAQVDPVAERCNGEDDDCDGSTDEGTALPCYPDDTPGCTRNDDGSYTCAGACAPGVQACESGAQNDCAGMVTPTSVEDCNSDPAVDDDCDGKVDEECSCNSGDTKACYGGASGTELRAPCMPGTQTCAPAGTFDGDCTGDRVPEQETCANDGADDDCDGATDEIPNRYMVCTDAQAKGVCRLGEFGCDGDAFTCVTPDASDEQCNALDDDCDGSLDEDFLLLTDEQNCGQCGKQCSAELTCCGGQCVDLNADERYCGSCGEPCGEGATCCNGTCVDTDTSPLHCGACGEACGAGRECCGGGCVDTRVNTDHCGSCNEGCATGESCCTGQCADEDSPVCATCSEDCEANGETCCFGSCVDPDSDESNCGGCGNACDPGEVCCRGDCVASNPSHCGQACTACNAGALCCGGSCVPSDGANCHTCGNICTGGTTCCGVTGCKNLLTDPNNCGSCGEPVDDGDVCVSGHSCPPNNGWCNGACTSLETSQNCGMCGRTCAALLQSCVDMMCRLL